MGFFYVNFFVWLNNYKGNVMETKVVVVDNNKVILRLMTNYFQQRGGYQVVTAEDGLEALHVLEPFKPSLMFVDLRLPKINGEKLCRIIRKMPEYDSTYIIIISAIAAEEEVDFASFGANACIAKGPFGTMQQHISTVLSHWENKEATPLSKEIFGREDIYKRAITKELLATRKHFEATLENMVDGFLELTVDENIIFANRAATELFELSEEALLSSFFPDLFAAEQRPLIEEALASLGDKSIEIGEETAIVLHDRYLFIRLVPFSDQNQNFIIVIVQDISQRKQTELELIEYKKGLENLVAQRTRAYEEANEQLQDEINERSKVQEQLKNSIDHWQVTFDIMSDYVSVHDRNMRFVKVNKALADLLGKKQQEIIGEQCYELLHSTKEPWPTCPHIQAMDRQDVVTEEIEEPYLGKTLLVTCSPFFDIEGEVIGTVHVARDITRQKRAQEERETLVKKLQATLDEVKTLRGILPICSFCKNIRNDEGYYEQIEAYIHKHSGVDFSHTVCPKCMREHYPEYIDEKDKS